MRRIAVAVLAVLGLAIAAATASAETYPSRTVTIIVPYPAGGPTDTTARQIANSLTKILGGNFIVENVSGGSTIIATSRLAHAAPDGYTLLMHNLQISANATLFKTLPFDTEKQIAPVALVNQNPLVLVGRPGLPANNLKELLALMKKETLKEALPGIGTTGHLMSAVFLSEAKVKADFIPYRGAAPAMNDLLGNHVDLFVATPQSIVNHVAAGKLKAFGVTSKQKLPNMPTAESLVDALGPKFDIAFWQGLFAPGGTPKEIVDKLNDAIAKAVSEPELLAIWAKQGFDPFPKDQRSVAAAQAFMKSEMARWGQVIRDNNITVTP